MQTIGHFNILERLGAGALGDVYRARDLKVGRTVALMAPSPELLADPADRAKFLADARAAMALNHPNIATLFDVIEDGDRCYLAYEFAAGPSLREEMGGRAVNPRRAVEIAAQITDALAEGHLRQIVHGDLRPENIVVTPKGSVKILNFGLTPWTTGGRARQTASSADALGADPVGVAGYLSPEQALGGSIDERSDLFSFGIVLQEMITGRNPFVGQTPAATVMNIIRMSPQMQSSASVPQALVALVGRTLAKPVERRPTAALQLSSELRSIGNAMDAREGHAPPTELIPKASPAKGNATVVNLWVVIAAVVVLVVVAVWLLGR